MQADSQKNDTLVNSKRAIVKRIKGLLRLHETFQALLTWPCGFLLVFLLYTATKAIDTLNAGDLWITLISSGIITIISSARSPTRSSLRKLSGQKSKRNIGKNKAIDENISLITARITAFIIDFSHRIQEQQERFTRAKQSHQRWALWYMSDTFSIAFPGIVLCILTISIAMCQHAFVFLPFILPVLLSAWDMFGIVILLRKKFNKLLQSWSLLSLQVQKWGENLEKQVSQEKDTILKGKESEG